MLRKVLLIPGQQRVHVGSDQVELAANLFRFARLEAADAEIGMQAGDDSLK
jgi:hypothetical protein